jgi:hypothetical protein
VMPFHFLGSGSLAGIRAYTPKNLVGWSPTAATTLSYEASGERCVAQTLAAKQAA